ncbi:MULTISPECIES: hydroxypyruvate isomerase [unclassified Marinobacter]|uniref:Hydroxypyruvate isomerase n=1 Tax=Marinobacter nauticus TaxID=2743 RepID=A0A455W9D8_MARNT|nr:MULTISPECIES: hydroxypyruvate isomerase [unclassified Marinobacter]QFS88835.1 Hydroxypyruvate isomerase [Marinobacter sp. THAF197a]QFT52620.1 Hydroxypyruvate isomerase [Marinobacter sp. THAF39]BBJ05930.1 hydroxypyruvate isomerase [Marinobacter nauticus]
MPRFAANLSMLFTEVPFLERFARARAAGFTAVEYLFPYDWPAEQLAEQLREQGLTQVLFNLPPGGWQAGERGIACLPDRVEEFRAGVDQGIAYARVLGNRQLNCLAGLKPADLDEQTAWETLVANVRYAADRFAEAGLTLCLEAINSRVDMPGFMLDTTGKVMALIEELDADNVRLQYDVYHMQIMEGDVIRTMECLLPWIGHIQFADNPGRHEPGTGEINFSNVFAALDRMGYQGWVSAEYRPSLETEDTLSWFRSAN